MQVNGAAEIPAYSAAILLLVRCGRRTPYASTLILAGCCLLSILLVPEVSSAKKSGHIFECVIPYVLVAFSIHLVLTLHFFAFPQLLGQTLFIPHLQGHPSVVMWIAVLGKFFVTISFSSAYIFTSELFPTALRGSGVGSSCFFSRLVRRKYMFFHFVAVVVALLL